MSSTAALREETIGNYIQYSANMLYLFESLITFPQEVDVIWGRKWIITTWLYALTRYSSVLLGIWLLIPSAQVTDECKVGQYINETISLAQFLLFALFSALRVYALLDGSTIIATLVFSLNLVPFGTNMYNYAKAVLIKNGNVCVSYPTGSDRLLLSLSLFTRISVILGDMLVLAVTWFKTAQIYNESRRLKINAPLATMLFRDGTFYFIILLILNVLQVLQGNIPALYTMQISEPFQQALTPIFICRFILNLRQANPAGSSVVSNTSLRFVGNMGQSLQFGGEQEDGDEIDVLSDDYEQDGHGTSPAVTDAAGGDIDVKDPSA